MKKKIRAAVVSDGNVITLRELDLEGPAPYEVLVKIVATGVCHTDLKCAETDILVKKRPVVLGHEGAGIVEAVGSAVSDLQPGDHVVMTFAYCGNCRSCRQAEPAYCYGQFPLNFSCERPAGGPSYLCEETTEIHGDFFGQSSFATYAIGSERNVIKVPDDVPIEILGPLGCGIQTGAGAVLNDFKVGPGDTIAIFGAGSLGLSAVMAARYAGAAKVVAVDRVRARLDLALELGADAVVDASATDAAAEIMRLTSGEGVNYALDTTGVASVMKQAINVLAPRGTCGFVTAPSSGEDLGVPVRNLLLGRKVRGIVEGNSNPKLFIPFLIDLYKRGHFPFDRLIRFYPFEAITEAFAAVHRGETIKPVLRIAEAA